MVGPGCDQKITRTTLLHHRCLVLNLYPVRAIQYLPLDPFLQASLTLLWLPRDQFTYCMSSSDWDRTVWDGDLRVERCIRANLTSTRVRFWMPFTAKWHRWDLYSISVRVQEDHRRTYDPGQMSVAMGTYHWSCQSWCLLCKKVRSFYMQIPSCKGPIFPFWPIQI